MNDPFIKIEDLNFSYTDEEGNDRMKEQIQENYNRIKADVRQIVADELERIKNDPTLAHLLQQK